MNSKTRFNIIAVLIILLWTALIYCNTFSNSFHYDDKPAITDNEIVGNISNLYRIHKVYRPALNITFILNYYFNGWNVFGYHLVNLITHILVCILIYFIVDRLCSRSNGNHNYIDKDIKINLFPIFTSLAFATHPINSQTVNYISARSSSLCALFYLLSFYFFMKYLKNERYGNPVFKSILFYLGSLVAFILALAARETAITLPTMLLIYDYCFCAADRPRFVVRKFKLYHIPYWSIIVIGFIKSGIPEIPEIIVPFLTNVLMACKAYAYYIWLLFVPIDLSIDHYFPISDSFLQFHTVVSIGVVILLIVFAITVFRKLKIISFALFIYFIPLVPTSSVLLTNSGSLNTMIAEHRIYLSAIGFSISIVITILYISELLTDYLNCKSYIIQCSLIIPILIFYSVTTVRRNFDWRSDLTLWTSAVEHSPKSPGAHNNLGMAYNDEGNVDKAVSEYKEAITLNPRFYWAYNNLGHVLEKTGNLDEAIKVYEISLNIRPNRALTHNNLGVVYFKKGLFNKATEQYTTAIYLDPNYYIAYANLGDAYYAAGQLDEAVKAYSKSINLDPLAFKPHNNLGAIYLKKGFYDKAVSEFELALQIKPDYSEAGVNIASAYAQKGQFEDAVTYYENVLIAQPRHAEAHYGLGIVYGKQRIADKALFHLKESLKYQTDHSRAKIVEDIINKFEMENNK